MFAKCARGQVGTLILISEFDSHRSDFKNISFCAWLYNLMMDLGLRWGYTSVCLSSFAAVCVSRLGTARGAFSFFEVFPFSFLFFLFLIFYIFS